MWSAIIASPEPESKASQQVWSIYRAIYLPRCQDGPFLWPVCLAAKEKPRRRGTPGLGFGKGSSKALSEAALSAAIWECCSGVRDIRAESRWDSGSA
jgi:hypothetical protein